MNKIDVQHQKIDTAAVTEPYSEKKKEKKERKKTPLSV